MFTTTDVYILEFGTQLAKSHNPTRWLVMEKWKWIGNEK
jgi:hypothetical protein